MTDIKRFFAPGPWVTRDLKECVRASDYDALAARLAALEAAAGVSDHGVLTKRCVDAETRLAEALAANESLSRALNNLVGARPTASGDCAFVLAVKLPDHVGLVGSALDAEIDKRIREYQAPRSLTERHGDSTSDNAGSTPAEGTTDSALQMLVGTYTGQNTIHAKDVLTALNELQKRRAADSASGGSNG